MPVLQRLVELLVHLLAALALLRLPSTFAAAGDGGLGRRVDGVEVHGEALGEELRVPSVRVGRLCFDRLRRSPAGVGTRREFSAHLLCGARRRWHLYLLHLPELVKFGAAL